MSVELRVCANGSIHVGTKDNWDTFPEVVQAPDGTIYLVDINDTRY